MTYPSVKVFVCLSGLQGRNVVTFLLFKVGAKDLSEAMNDEADPLACRLSK